MTWWEWTLALTWGPAVALGVLIDLLLLVLVMVDGVTKRVPRIAPARLRTVKPAYLAAMGLLLIGGLVTGLVGPLGA